MPGGQKAPELTDPAEIELWEKICAHQDESFTTSGRGRRLGTHFSYKIHGAEMFVSSRAKSITRSTILYAFHKVREMEEQGIMVSGPKSIGVHGDSSIFAVFKEIGVITRDICTAPERGDVLDSHDSRLLFLENDGNIQLNWKRDLYFFSGPQLVAGDYAPAVSVFAWTASALMARRASRFRRALAFARSFSSSVRNAV